MCPLLVKMRKLSVFKEIHIHTKKINSKYAKIFKDSLNGRYMDILCISLCMFEFLNKNLVNLTIKLGLKKIAHTNT